MPERRCGSVRPPVPDSSRLGKGPATVVLTPEGQPRHSIDLFDLPSSGPAFSVSLAYAPGWESPWKGSEGKELLGRGWNFTFPCLVKDSAEGGKITLILEGVERIDFFGRGDEESFVNYRRPTLRLTALEGDRYLLSDPVGNRILFAGFSAARPLPVRGKPLAYEIPYRRGEKGVTFKWTDSGLPESIRTSSGALLRFHGENGHLKSMTAQAGNGVLLYRVFFVYGDPQGNPGSFPEALAAVRCSRPGDPRRFAERVFRYHREGNTRGLLAYVMGPAETALSGGYRAALDLPEEEFAQRSELFLDYEIRPGLLPSAVVSRMKRGSCSSCASGGEYTFSYFSNPGLGAVNSWAASIFQTDPGGAMVSADYNRYGGLLNLVRSYDDGRNFKQEAHLLRYDPAGNVEYVIRPASGWFYDYKKHNVLRLKGDEGFVRRYRYDQLNRLRSEEVGGTDLLSETRHGGWITVRTYAYEDALPWPSEKREYPNEDGEPVVTRFRYDFLGPREDLRLLRAVEILPPVPPEENGRGEIAERVTEYDPRSGLPTRIVDEEGRVTLYSYDPGTGLLKRRTVDPQSLSLTVSFEYDPWGRTVKKTFPDGLSVVSFRKFLADGREILDGASKVQIMGSIVPVRARIWRIEGLSAHADQPILVDWALHADPEQVFLVHGEEPALTALSQRLTGHGLSVHVPAWHETVEL